MRPEKSSVPRVEECCLTWALAPLAHTTACLGARSVSVMVFERSGFLRMVYQWPEPPPGFGDLRLKADSVGSPEQWKGVVGANSAIGEFLKRATASAGSFYLVPWPDPERRVVIAYGMRAGASCPVIPEGTAAAIQLAAFAACSAVEVRRLRSELSILNDRLGRRKVVERAKGLLQASNGWSEQQAYEQLRRLSRQRRKTLAETAEDLLRLPRPPTE